MVTSTMLKNGAKKDRGCLVVEQSYNSEYCLIEKMTFQQYKRFIKRILFTMIF